MQRARSILPHLKQRFGPAHGLAVLVIAGLVLTLGWGLEALVRHSNLDQRLVRRSLYYQQFVPNLHVADLASPLHYRLKPNASWQGQPPGGNAWTATIGPLGERGPSHPLQRPAGHKRVLMVGGSTLFGFEVSDLDTMAHALQRELTKQAGNKPVEVWNYGTCAYTLAQAAAQAVELVPVLLPDLIVVQLYNRGRRAYLWPDAEAKLPLAAVYAEPSAVLENLPLPPVVPAAWRIAAIRTSALARAVSAGWRLATSPAGVMDSESTSGDALSTEWAGRLLSLARAAKVPVLFVAIPAADEQVPDHVHPTATASEFFAIPADPADPATQEVHPPARVLQAWAEALARVVEQRALLE